LNIHEERIFIQQLQRWEPTAWKHLATEYGSYLRQFILESLSAHQLDSRRRSEIEQQTWRTVVENIDQFVPRPDYRLLDWLKELQADYVSQMTDEFPFFRRQRRLCNKRDGTQDASREIFSALDLVLQQIPHVQREIVLQHFVQRLDTDQLAQQYGLTSGVIDQILVNAKKKLRDLLLASDLFMRAQFEPEEH
jgi:RNA polymerase sigma factor (sigma-70 family)